MNSKTKQPENGRSILSVQGHGHICHPSELKALTRRELLLGGTSLTGFAMASQISGSSQALAAVTYPPVRRLVWINMSGGWDILEATDPKPASTSGIDMMYEWGLAHTLTGSTSTDRVGRWLGRLAAHGRDMVVVRGMNMGTTSHMAGSIYMDTGILSNTGTVNAASVPAMVASESQATIPIIQLNGGADPRTDRGLLNPVSVVRAQNLDLYRSMYPTTDNDLAQKIKMLDYVQSSIARVKARTGSSDRLSAIETSQEKIRLQFTDQVGGKLALTNADRAAFAVGAPAILNGGQRDAFALSLKLLKNNLVTCLNLGIGGFDTHANQERQMQPVMDNFDYLLATFVSELKAAGQLDTTLIVVYSDFGRTPKVNNSSGRDHWPFGGALMLGGGIDGGRFVGKTDDDLRGLNINATTGEEETTGLNLNPTHLAGSVLQLTLGTDYMKHRPYLEAIPGPHKVEGGIDRDYEEGIPHVLVSFCSYRLARHDRSQGRYLEDRLATGSNLFVPTAFPLNPAANSTNRTIFAAQRAKRDEKIDFVLNPGNNQAAVAEKITKTDTALGGQIPMGGASIGLSYSEHRRDVTAKHENRGDANHELFVNRDYRMNFAVDFTSTLRGAFTFHYTALQSDLDGSFNVNNADRTHYRGTQSGYGLGLYYDLTVIKFGAFSHAPMRGKATIEGEQKIITEPGIYGLNADYIVNPGGALSFHARKWSYKHDERDDPSTSPIDQRDILLRGLDLHQFYRKTFAYALAGEFALTPMVFLKGQYLRQDGVFLFDPDRVPGDDKERETSVKYTEYRAGAAIKNRDFNAELGVLMNSANEGSIPSQGAGFGALGSYKASALGYSLMVGASF